MIHIEEKKHCSGCSACANICPKQCVQMISCSEGFLYPQVEAEKCIDCGLCEKICPINNINLRAIYSETQRAYAAINTDEIIRFESSSGGLFTLLAERIIEDRGVVFGVAFESDFKSVSHKYVDTIKDLEGLRGSKYIQSRIGNNYRKVKEFLDAGRLVLFTGTPCQIGGLYAFLGHDYKNLITQDMICHGVPSPMVWKKYVEFREKQAGSQTQRISFRYKKSGWKTYSVRFEFKNYTRYEKTITEDLYMRGFLANLYLRPSCYHCSFKGSQRFSDITLADFWGIQNVMPEMDDNKGTSLVIINSNKGKTLFDCIKTSIKYRQADLDEAIKYNSAAIKSACMPADRERFFFEINRDNFNSVLKRYCEINHFEKIKYKINIVFSKIKKQ